MTLREFSKYYEQQLKYHEDTFKIQERLTARVLCLLANINRDSKKKRTPFKEDDFIASSKKQKGMSLDEMATILRVITLANGGEVNG